MRFFPYLFAALAAIAIGAPAFAGVGVTSSGVVTTDPNAPSTEVQQQSSGFVAANQQMQNSAATGGIAVPGAASSTGHSAANAASTNANAEGANAANGAAHAATPPVPPPPPPPPPTYESKMRPVTRSPDPAPAPATAAPTAPAVSVQKPVAANQKPAEPVPVAAPKTQPMQTPAAAASKTQEVPVVTDPGGGRGAAPDGYTFWFGLLIAGALLALAAVTWMKIQRGESPD
ncbi:MAG: hypothetical protein DYH18_05840 [Xanthomonadales bacterium PRO7]|nr:hypothetical protein [Xanthomonadales bacterium PRO7]